MAAPDIALGFAAGDDAQYLAALARDLIESGLGWEYRAHRIAALIGDADVIALVARTGSTRAGFALMRVGDDRAHLVLLAVQPAHQRRGIARGMIEWLLESARIAGMCSIHVELRASNAPAYAFYRSMGFCETFRVPGYYRGRETAVRMLRMVRVPGSDRYPWPVTGGSTSE